MIPTIIVHDASIISGCDKAEPGEEHPFRRTFITGISLFLCFYEKYLP